MVTENTVMWGWPRPTVSKQHLGVNYYANKNVRLGMSYMDGEEANGASGDEVRARLQYAF
jgi:phosphate-selective porin